MWFPGVTSQCHADNACLMLVAQTLTEVSFSGFLVGCCIYREKVICYQLEFRK